MSLRTVRNDSDALVLRQKNYAELFGFFGCLVLLVVMLVSGAVALWNDEMAGDSLQKMVTLGIVGFIFVIGLTIGLVGSWRAPFDETLCFNRNVRRLLILRRRVRGVSRDELSFDQVRAITVEPGFLLALVTDSGTVRFPS